MEYHTHPDIAGEPTLAEMTQKAIQILQKNPNGFVLLVEGKLVQSKMILGQSLPYSICRFHAAAAAAAAGTTTTTATSVGI